MLTFVICVGTSVPVYLVPQFFAVSAHGYGFGASATEIGFFLLPGAVGAASAGPIAGIGARRFGSRAVVTAGIVVMVAALIALAAVHTEVWHLVVGKMLIALANGLCVTAMVTSTATSVDRATPASPPAWSWSPACSASPWARRPAARTGAFGARAAPYSAQVRNVFQAMGATAKVGPSWTFESRTWMAWGQVATSTQSPPLGLL